MVIVWQPVEITWCILLSEPLVTRVYSASVPELFVVRTIRLSGSSVTIKCIMHLHFICGVMVRAELVWVNSSRDGIMAWSCKAFTIRFWQIGKQISCRDNRCLYFLPWLNPSTSFSFRIRRLSRRCCEELKCWII